MRCNRYISTGPNRCANEAVVKYRRHTIGRASHWMYACAECWTVVKARSHDIKQVRQVA